MELRGWDRFPESSSNCQLHPACAPPSTTAMVEGEKATLINRCGNLVVRYTRIEMVSRMTRWHPDYPSIKKLRNMVSKRGKRRLVVAAARRLAIDLWHWGHGSSHGSRTWSATPTDYEPEAKAFNAATNTNWNGACTGSRLGARKRPNIRWYRSFRSPFICISHNIRI